jgi:hypothetical protein
MLRKLSIIAAISFLIVLTANILVFSYPGGITGRTKKTGTNGCGSCHSQNTSITGMITGPDTVLYGQTVNYTVTITRSGSNAKGGVDISARLGTLAPGPGASYLRALNSELTQLPANGLTLTNGTFTCQFSYTAPSVSGFDTIWLTEAIGHSNGWNWGTEKSIFVRNPLGIQNNNSPVQFQLFQNYPNPFNPETKITFELPERSNVIISVYDISGREIENIVNSEYNAGRHEIIWDASKFSTGVYFYRIDTDSFTETKKMMMVK